jgi:tripartite-type tricarboxylate transporter receptor subunit TctC
LPVASVKELIALAKAQPGKLTYASSGTGGIFHLGSELLCVLAGVQMTHVPFKGVAEGYPAVISGQVDWIFGSPISALPFIKAGRLRGIAVTSAARSKWLPDLPTVAESGLPGYEVDAWFGLFAPSRTPGGIIDRLHAEAGKAMRAPAVERRMQAEATEVVLNAPREFSAQVKAEYENWRSLVARAGLKVQ